MSETNDPEELAAEVKRLSGRVDTLMMQRNPPEQMKQLYENSVQLTRHEHALFGVMGNNGLTGQVRELREGLAGLHQAIQTMRDSELAEVQGRLEKIHRWALAVVPATLMAGVMIALAIFTTHQ